MNHYRVTWEMTVFAESQEDAEAEMQSFAMNAERLGMTNHYDNFDTSALKHSPVEPVGGTWAT